MANEVSDIYVKQYTNNVELLLQQTMPRFMGAVDAGGSYVGEAAQKVVQFGEAEFQERTVDLGDTEFAEIEHRQRWVYPTTYDLAIPVQKSDQIKVIVDLQGPYTKAMHAAWARRWDQTVIDSFFADARTGKDGGSTTPFATATQVVAVGAGASGATGLNIEKLIQAREKLSAAEVDLDVETPYIAVTSKQISDMLRTVEATSADYAQLKRLESGEIDTFMGFRFIRSERLPVDGSSYRRLPVWVPSGIHAGQWNGFTVEIGKRPDKKYITQVYMEGTIGATRTQEKKVVEIKASES